MKKFQGNESIIKMNVITAYMGDERMGEDKNDPKLLSLMVFCLAGNTVYGKCFMLAFALTMELLSLRS